MPKFTHGMLVKRSSGCGKHEPEFGIVTCVPSENNTTTVKVNGFLCWSQDSWIPAYTQGELALLTERLCFQCPQQQEASLSGKNSVNVRLIGSARRRARLSQNAQSLLSEKKKETLNRTHSIDSVKLPPLSLETISRVLKKQGQLHGLETDVGGWLFNAGKIIDSGRFGG